MSQWYGVREATLFLVDTTQKMFEIELESKLSHIQKFFKLYKQILRQKLAWSMKDWMGVVLFGTEESDVNLAWKNIQILHELRIVTLDDLQKIRKLTKNNLKDYQSMKCESKDSYPLYNALTYCMDIFVKIKTVLTKRRVVLITCHSPEFSEDEKYRIMNKAKDLKDLDIKLYVIGLGKSWVPNQFYKDLEILSRKTDVDVYRMTSLVDLVQQIKAPSKNIGRLSLQMYDGLEIDLVVRTLGRKRRCLQTKPLSKATNQVLSRSTYFKGEGLYDEEDSDSEELDLVIPEDVNLESKELIGGKKLRFTQRELFRIRHIHSPAIKVIGVKPIPDDLFRYHVKRKYFVRADYGSTRKDNLLFFSALLNKCAAKGRMIVCALTLRVNTQTTLCYMIPNVELGGFYLSKIAYQGNIGDKSEALLYYENHVSDKEVKLWKKTIDRLDMNYHPSMFRSYKLECQIQIVERLALDKKPGPLPIDSIEQSYLKTYEKTADLVPELKRMYSDIIKPDGPTRAKRAKKNKET